MQSRDHWRKPYWLKAFGVSLGEMEAVIKGIHDVLGDGRALTRQQLSVEVAARVRGDTQQRLFADSWGALLKPAAAAGVLAFGPSVGRNVSFVRPDRWLPNWRDVDPVEAIQEVLRKFVHMHGPTRPENFVHWWHKALAERFIDFYLRPDVSAEVANFVQVDTGNSASVGLLDRSVRENPIVFPPTDVVARLAFTEDLGDDEKRYTDAWKRVMEA